jgi:hypothetical protein
VVPSLATRAREQKLKLRLEVLVALVEGFDVEGGVSLKLARKCIGYKSSSTIMIRVDGMPVSHIVLSHSILLINSLVDKS